MHFLQMIHPLLSRPQDKSHCEQTEKQFVQVAQHAARITLMAAKKGTDFEFKFPTLGEKFVEERMLTVTSDSLGLDTAPKRVTALYNGVSGQMVRLAMLPEVTALTRDARGDWRQRRVYKANVLLC